MTAMTLDKALVPNTAGSFGKSYLKRDPLELYQLLKQKSSLKSEINKTAIKDSGSKGRNNCTKFPQNPLAKLKNKYL